MNFDEVMRTFDGKWEDGFALIRGRDGYIWKIAEGTPDRFALTFDGKRYVTEDASAEAESEKPRRGRKPSVVL
jgi:hypothetical protein